MKLRISQISVGLACVLLATFVACSNDGPTGPENTTSDPKPLSFDNFQAAVLVIGQPDMSSGLQNAGGAPSAFGLREPRGAPTPGSFYVADRRNHRVLGFDKFPTSSGTAADFVIGQPDFTSGSSGTTASSFSFPDECIVARNKLLVVDQGNQRVLIWNTLPKGNTPADVVVGQPDFTSGLPGETTRSSLWGPSGATVAAGKLFIADRLNSRVLIWNSIPTTNNQPADLVVGQSDFTSNDAGLSATTLEGPMAVWADASKLVISDYGNHRVLIYNSIPIANGAAADVVVGAPDFSTDGSDGSGNASATNLGETWGVASDGTSLFVADNSNHRVLIYPFPTVNGAAATGVLGQTNFTLNAGDDPDQDGILSAESARTFQHPAGLAIIGNRLLVTDSSNNRVLVFNSK